MTATQHQRNERVRFILLEILLDPTFRWVIFPIWRPVCHCESESNRILYNIGLLILGHSDIDELSNQPILGLGLVINNGVNDGMSCFNTPRLI